MDVIGKLPRFAGASGRLFKRSHFLDGTLKAYFGPGQAPDGMTDAAGYRAPSKWNNIGALLRPIQQVWITNWVNSTYVVGAGLDPFELIPIYYKPYYDAAIETKTEIERLRPGITYVDIVDYNFYGVCGGLNIPYFPYPPTYFGLPNPNTNMNFALNIGGMEPHLIAPNPGEQFFGTNFLHFAWITNTGRSTACLTTPYASNSPYPGFFDLSTLSHDDQYKYCKSRIVGSYPKFAGYSVYLYSFTYIDTGIYSIVGDIPSYDVLDDDLVDYCNAVANDLGDYGYHYGGGASQVNSRNMIDIIAKTFNFDPDTGKDLPVA